MMWRNEEGKDAVKSRQIKSGNVRGEREMDMLKKNGMKFGKKFGMAKKITAKGMAALLAAALMMGMTPYPGRTAYAEPDDGYEGDGIEGDDNGGYESDDDAGSQDPDRTEYDYVENEDGTWTFIETYYEDGVKTGSKEETGSTDGSQTVTVIKDAEGNVTETTTETRTYNEE